MLLTSSIRYRIKDNKVFWYERPNAHAIRNSGFSVRAIILLSSLLQSACPVRLYRKNKQKKQKKDAVANSVNIQGGRRAITPLRTTWWRDDVMTRQPNENPEVNARQERVCTWSSVVMGWTFIKYMFTVYNYFIFLKRSLIWGKSAKFHRNLEKKSVRLWWNGSLL